MDSPKKLMLCVLTLLSINNLIQASQASTPEQPSRPNSPKHPTKSFEFAAEGTGKFIFVSVTPLGYDPTASFTNGNYIHYQADKTQTAQVVTIPHNSRHLSSAIAKFIIPKRFNLDGKLYETTMFKIAIKTNLDQPAIETYSCDYRNLKNNDHAYLRTQNEGNKTNNHFGILIWNGKKTKIAISPDELYEIFALETTPSPQRSLDTDSDLESIESNYEGPSLIYRHPTTSSDSDKSPSSSSIFERTQSQSS